MKKDILTVTFLENQKDNGSSVLESLEFVKRLNRVSLPIYIPVNST